jgi:hypothetical protein
MARNLSLLLATLQAEIRPALIYFSKFSHCKGFRGVVEGAKSADKASILPCKEKATFLNHLPQLSVEGAPVSKTERRFCGLDRNFSIHNQYKYNYLRTACPILFSAYCTTHLPRAQIRAAVWQRVRNILKVSS